MQRSKNDVWVGLFVLIGLAAVLFLALKSANLLQFSWSKDYTVTAKFDNIGGLKVRGPVKSAGVVVGRVSAIRFDPQTYEAHVVLKIDSQYQFPRDTFASILTSGLLGEQYIGLDAGGDETMIPAGGTIAKTQSAIVLEKLISQFLFNKASEGKKDARAE